MTARGGRFGAINVAGLENTLEAGDAMLLVELWALREIRNTFEIPDGEEIRAALRPPAYDLRRDDFREVIRCQEFAEVPQNRRLDSKNVANAFASQRERAIVQKDVAANRCDIG